MRWLGWPLTAAAALLSGCGPQDPRAARIDNIEDLAQSQADAIDAAAGNEAGRMRNQAEGLAAQAQNTTGFDAERLQTRADALRAEAKIVDRQADAKTRAVRDRAQAEVSAIKAQ